MSEILAQIMSIPPFLVGYPSTISMTHKPMKGKSVASKHNKNAVKALAKYKVSGAKLNPVFIPFGKVLTKPTMLECMNLWSKQPGCVVQPRMKTIENVDKYFWPKDFIQ